MKLKMKIRMLCKFVPRLHPCGDCINYGDFECMSNMSSCEYSDKIALNHFDNNNKYWRYLKWN